MKRSHAKNEGIEFDVSASALDLDGGIDLDENMTEVQVRLAEDVPGNTIEERSKNQFSALTQGFRDARHESERRVNNAIDSEYWFCVCFKNREQKDRFLSALKLSEIGDKYLDGELVAMAFGVDLPKVNLFERRPSEVKKLHGVEVI